MEVLYTFKIHVPTLFLNFAGEKFSMPTILRIHSLTLVNIWFSTYNSFLSNHKLFVFVVTNFYKKSCKNVILREQLLFFL